MLSVVQKRGVVSFPANTGQRVYMREIFKRLPFDLRRWQPTVDQMLDGIDVTGPMYLMIDQGMVQAGTSHRRSGVHVDGYWVPALCAHGNKPGHHISVDRHGWRHCNFITPEALLLASDVQGCRAYEGQWDGKIGEGGDCAAIPLTGLKHRNLQANRCYAGNVTMLHESLPLSQTTNRQLVRINVPRWTPD